MLDYNKMRLYCLGAYLRNNLYTTDFINNHTRPELAAMLKRLYQKNNWTTNMCKKRQVAHLKSYMMIHDMKCKE